jgi:uncharacterized protein (DUF952 family)
MIAKAIYHVTTRFEWEKALPTGSYQSDSLISQGFIHCSEKDQIPGVLERYYAGQKDLVILKINPAKVGEIISYEGLPEGELFPHIYGFLVIEAVESVYRLEDVSTALSQSGDWAQSGDWVQSDNWEVRSETPGENDHNDLLLNPKG